MKISKTTIRKKIFISYITIITISLLLIFLVFNLYLSIYIQRQTNRQLVEVATSIEKLIVDTAMDLSIAEKSGRNVNNEKNLLLISKNLKNTESFIDVNYAIISVLVSNAVSKKISRPILLLSNYAKKIGDREYQAELIKYEKNDEIGQLAETMQSMTEKLATYDSTMKGFMQNASHELRTPLMSIQGYAEGIKYGVVEEQDKAIDIIIEESKRLSDLVEDLLYLSKIETTQDELNLEEINVEYMMKSSIERINGIAVKNGKNIKFSCNDHSKIIIGDEEKITRAIINIL